MTTYTYAIEISTGGEYIPRQGWASTWTDRRAAEAARRRAADQDGWEARIVTLTAAEADDWRTAWGEG